MTSRSGFLFPHSDRRKPDLDVIRVGWALSALGAEGDLTREVQITHILSEGELQVQGSAGFQGTSAGHAQAFWSKSLSVTGDCLSRTGNSKGIRRAVSTPLVVLRVR